MSAVNKAVSSDWLSVDTKANVGTGTSPYTPSNTDQPPAKFGYVPTGVQAEQVQVAENSTELLAEPTGWAGNFPWVDQSQGMFGHQLPIQREQGRAENTGNNVTEPAPHGHGYDPRTNAYTNLNEYAGYDAHSQMTDTQGWKQNTPTGRSATRQRFGDSSRGVQNYWNPVAERPTPARTALRAQAPIDGTGLPGSAVTPGGANNTAYTAPVPPPTSDAQPNGGAIDPMAGGWA